MVKPSLLRDRSCVLFSLCGDFGPTRVIPALALLGHLLLACSGSSLAVCQSVGGEFRLETRVAGSCGGCASAHDHEHECADHENERCGHDHECGSSRRAESPVADGRLVRPVRELSGSAQCSFEHCVHGLSALPMRALGRAVRPGRPGREPNDAPLRNSRASPRLRPGFGVTPSATSTTPRHRAGDLHDPFRMVDPSVSAIPSFNSDPSQRSGTRESVALLHGSPAWHTTRGVSAAPSTPRDRLRRVGQPSHIPLGSKRNEDGRPLWDAPTVRSTATHFGAPHSEPQGNEHAERAVGAIARARVRELPFVPS